VELSELGLSQGRAAAEQLAGRPIDVVWHSGMVRARVLAELLATQTGACCVEEPALRERDFGAWEGRRWDDLYAETGAAMDGMILAPDTFRPPGGETTHELRDRVLAWYRSLPEDGSFVAVTHGGPIAALRGTLAREPPTAWPQLVPAHGTWVELVAETIPIPLSRSTLMAR
jgi:broad specificity phosphatase PhoE